MEDLGAEQSPVWGNPKCMAARATTPSRALEMVPQGSGQNDDVSSRQALMSPG